MIFGILILIVFFCVFIVTHFLDYSPEQSPMELAGELAIVILSGLLLIAFVIIIRHYL